MTKVITRIATFAVLPILAACSQQETDNGPFVRVLPELNLILPSDIECIEADNLDVYKSLTENLEPGLQEGGAEIPILDVPPCDAEDLQDEGNTASSKPPTQSTGPVVDTSGRPPNGICIGPGGQTETCRVLAMQKFLVTGEVMPAVGYCDTGKGMTPCTVAGTLDLASSLDLDWKIQGTERIHAFIRPVDGKFFGAEGPVSLDVLGLTDEGPVDTGEDITVSVRFTENNDEREIIVPDQEAQKALSGTCITSGGEEAPCSVITVSEIPVNSFSPGARPGLCQTDVGAGQYSVAYRCFVTSTENPVLVKTELPASDNTSMLVKVTAEIGIGADIPGNRPSLGPVRQETDRKLGVGGDLMIYMPVYEWQDFEIISGVQVIGGQTKNDAFVNPGAGGSVPFGGRTRYYGGTVLLGANYQISDRFSLRGFGALGAASVDFNGILGGVQVVSGSTAAGVARFGIAGFYEITDGLEVGAGVDLAHLTGFDTVTNTGVRLEQGSTTDVVTTLRVRMVLGNIDLRY